MTAGTLKIGRVDAIGNMSRWDIDGDHITVEGLIPQSDITYAKAIRQQLLGYADNPDEEIIPVTHSADTTIDGYYRPLSAKVDVNTPGRLTIGYFPYTVELLRVPGYASPLFESILLGALRVNGHGIVTGTSIAWHGIPDATAFYDVGVALSAAVSRVGASGTILIEQGGSNAVYNARARWRLPPASFYTSGALIEIGSTLRTVVGRQIENLPVNWRLSNDLLRVTPVAGSSSIDISCYDGTQWDTTKRFKLGTRFGFFNSFGTWAAVTIIRNSPEACTIRLTAPPTSSTRDGQYFVDLTLRRGSRVLEVTMTSRIAFQGMVQLNTTEAATALTGGIRATANDAAGNRYLLSSPIAFTSDLVNGSIYNTATATAVPFALGFEVAGSGAAGLEAAQSLINQYMAAVTARLVVAGN